MRLVDLTRSSAKKIRIPDVVPVVVKSTEAVDRIPLSKLVTLATVVDLTGRAEDKIIGRMDIAGHGLAGIDGCILRTGWCDGHFSGLSSPAPVLSVDAAAVLLGAGIRTVAADFPIMGAAADMLLHNQCVLVHCLSNIDELSRPIVRLVALPLKLEGTYCADARVIAIEE